MARANRHFIPGCVWHITHRCHKKEFLLKFAHDRSRYVQWLYQARRRYGVQILNYAVTSNHIHLLIRDDGKDSVIPSSMQLVAGRAAQEYNTRKRRKGAFWEDRYHATVIETGDHLRRCLVYIDLNMVRAGVVDHPGEWRNGGYREIQGMRRRNTVIALDALAEAAEVGSVAALTEAHGEWVEMALASDVRHQQEDFWTRSIAVGSEAYVNRIKGLLGTRGRGRDIREAEGALVIREEFDGYGGDSEPENRPIDTETGVSEREFLLKTGG